MAGTLEGLENVRPGNDLRVKPYVLGSSGKSTFANVGNDFKLDDEVRWNARVHRFVESRRITGTDERASIVADEQPLSSRFLSV